MNMVSKGVQNVLEFLQDEFPDMEVGGISGELLQLLSDYGLWQLIILICTVASHIPWDHSGS